MTKLSPFYGCNISQLSVEDQQIIKSLVPSVNEKHYLQADFSILDNGQIYLIGEGVRPNSLMFGRKNSTNSKESEKASNYMSSRNILGVNGW